MFHPTSETGAFGATPSAPHVDVQSRSLSKAERRLLFAKQAELEQRRQNLRTARELEAASRMTQQPQLAFNLPGEYDRAVIVRPPSAPQKAQEQQRPLAGAVDTSDGPSCALQAPAIEAAINATFGRLPRPPVRRRRARPAWLRPQSLSCAPVCWPPSRPNARPRDESRRAICV